MKKSSQELVMQWRIERASRLELSAHPNEDKSAMKAALYADIIISHFSG